MTEKKPTHTPVTDLTMLDRAATHHFDKTTRNERGPMRNYTMFHPHGAEGGEVCWISGIYKVLGVINHIGRTHIEYRAYFLADGCRGWGDRVSMPPTQINGRRYWTTQREAMRAVDTHESKSPQVTRRQIRWAKLAGSALIEDAKYSIARRVVNNA